jgi:uncharacterized membrane protein YdbT with pleckstrin-like domain
MAIREEVIYEGRIHPGDLVTNTVLLVTVIWLPIWVGSLVRWLFVRYRFTNLRLSVDSGWMGRDRTDVTYKEIVEVKDVPASMTGGLFGYGTLLLVLKDGARLELKAVPKFREIAERIRERMVNARPSTTSDKTAPKR